MKNKYGSTAQYNYDIKEQEHADHEYLLHKKTDLTIKKKPTEIASPAEESLREGERSPVNYGSHGVDDYMKKSPQPAFKKVNEIIWLLLNKYRHKFK